MNKLAVENDLRAALTALAGKLEKGAMIVTGCSTSEIAGGHIGKASVPEIGQWVAGEVIDFCKENGFVPVFQCCEHLNRSLVMEKEIAKRERYEQVLAIPQPKAGGSVPAAAWKLLESPTLVRFVQADAGIDIGDTLIGMHLRPVAVPLRCEIAKIGDANLVMAYSRLPYTGGARAIYE